MKLTPVQREILLALMDLYQKSKGEAIKGEDIAELIHKNPGTIRNQMQALRSLGLVEGVPGPKGGYRPTSEGYQILNFEKIEHEVRVPIFVGSKPLEGVTITSIDLISIPDPEHCRTIVHAMGNLKSINVGSTLKIGPTPVNKLVIRGKVLGRDDIDNVLLVDILEMVSIPKERIRDVATSEVITLSPSIPVREAAKIFVQNKIRGAPVVESNRLVGILTCSDIARAFAEGSEGLVKDVMCAEVRTIGENALLSDAIEQMNAHNVSRLIVVNGAEKPSGIITRTDILCRIASLCRYATPV